MIVLTLARGSSTSLDLRGELLTTGVLDNDFNALLSVEEGVPTVESDIFQTLSLVEVNQAIY